MPVTSHTCCIICGDAQAREGRLLDGRCYTDGMGRRETCRVDACERQTHVAGLCVPHYEQWRQGKPFSPGGRGHRPKLPRAGLKCRFPDCGRPVDAQGLCQGHYRHMLKGEELRPIRHVHPPVPGGKTGICIVEGCGRPRYGRGYCQAHYKQVRNGEEPRPLRVFLRQVGLCKVDGCDRPSRVRGYCRTHYKQQADGRPLRPIKKVNHPATHRAAYDGATCEFDGCNEPAKALGLCGKHYEQLRAGQEMSDGRPTYIAKDGIKRCGRCLRDLPATPEYFYREKQRVDGLYAYCRDCCRTYIAKYKVGHRDLITAHHQARRAQKLKGGGRYAAADVKAQLELQKGLCLYCGEPLNGEYHVDHFIPLSRGGNNWPENIVLACSGCNIRKHNQLPWEFMSDVFIEPENWAELMASAVAAGRHVAPTVTHKTDPTRTCKRCGRTLPNTPEFFYHRPSGGVQTICRECAPVLRRAQCSVADCDRVVKARGLCRQHWGEMRRGEPLSPGGRINKRPPDRCTFPDCDRPPPYAKGLCSGHYAQLSKGQTLRPLRVRVWARKTDPTRMCKRCGRALPNTFEYFPSAGHGAVKTTCKECASAMHKAAKCSVADCDRVVSAAGLCQPHYLQMQREEPLSPGGRIHKHAPDRCSFSGCDRPPPYRKGLCKSHYSQLQRGGSLHPLPK